MSRPTDSAIEACVDAGLEVATHAVEAMTPLVRQAVYQLLNAQGCRMGRDERSQLRMLACLQLEQNSRCP